MKKVMVLKKKLLLILLTALLIISLGDFTRSFSVNVLAAGNVYYVATTGNDTTGDGSLTNPWKTIQKAASIMTAGDTCEIRGGIYRETVIPTNNGTDGNRIKFKAYNGEIVTVSGADLVTGWNQYNGDIYRATLPTKTIDVFVDGIQMTQARWPNKNGLDKLVRDFGVVDSGTVNTLVDANLPGGDDYWNGATVWFTGGGSSINWTAQTSIVTDYDASSHTLTFQEPQCTFWHRVPAGGSFFYLMGKLSQLDAVNEWHYEDGKLYLWAPGGGDPSSKTVEAKRRKWAFDLTGKKYIELNGINIFAASANLEDAQYCVIDACDFKYVASDPWINYTYNRGGYGDHTKIAPWWDSTWNDVGVYMSGSYNVLKNSTIAYSFGDCVTVLGSNNTVKNNIIHDSNFSATESGVLSVKGKNHEIVCNTMYNGGRSILQFNYVEGGRFMYNNMYQPGKLSRDLGVAYCYITDGKGCEIAYNWVHDNHCPGAGAGIYLDNGCSNFVVHHNVVWNCPTMNGIFYNAPAISHETYNNTIWDCGDTEGIGMNSPHTDNKVYNNLSNKPFAGDDLQNNLHTTSPDFVGTGNDGLKYLLSASSSAVDYGRIITGITDGYKGTLPDAGAYEYNGTAWAAGHEVAAPPAPAPVPITPLTFEKFNNTDEKLTFTPGWDYYPNIYINYLGDLHFSKTPGDYVEFTFEGNAIKWIGGKNADHGKVDIYIDGILDTQGLDTYASSYLPQQELYSKIGLSDGSHTIKIVLRNDKNASSTGYITDCDEFEVYRKQSITNSKDDNNNLAMTGSGRALVCKADQFGNAFSIMTDGVKTGNTSADSWDNKLKSEDFWGISFDKTYGFNKIVYTTGIIAVDGGWFASGLKAQVRQFGQWVDVTGLNLSPAYPYNNTAGPNNSYTLTFNDTWGDAVRVYGVPDQVSGYNFSFTTIGEFEAYYAN